jgi:DNA-binding transcriptional LysR family regulator
VGFGTTWLAPRLREFLQIYPEIQLTLHIDDQEVDLGMREADVAVRVTKPRQPDLIQRHLLTIRFHIYGAADYLKRRGVPKSVDDLKDHDLIIFGYDAKPPVEQINWIMEVGDPKPGERNAVLRINNQYAIFRAVRSGLGLAMLPDYMVDPEFNVVKVLPEVHGPSIEAFFVYAEELRHSKRIAAFRDFLLRKVAESRF